MAIELDIELRRESIAHAFWSRVPFRHVDLRLIVTNNTDHTQSKVSLELLVPEAAVYDFLGDLSWAPTNKREVMGVISPNPVTLLGGVFIHGGQIRPYQRYELTLQPFAPI